MTPGLLEPGSKVLVACEFSGIVRDAFIRKGCDALSCDLLPTETPGPHYCGDVRDIVQRKWDLIVAHPDCTYMTNSGVRWLFHPDDTPLPPDQRRDHPDHPGRRNFTAQAMADQWCQ